MSSSTRCTRRRDQQELAGGRVGRRRRASRPDLGGEAHAVLVGGDDLTDELLGTLGAYGATKVYRVKGPEGLAQPVVDAMGTLMNDHGYDYAVFGGGLLGFEIGAGLAARVGGGVTMEVTGIAVEDGKLVAERPILGDSSISTSRYKGKGIVIGRLNAFEAQEPTAPPRSRTSTSSSRTSPPARGWSRAASSAAPT